MEQNGNGEIQKKAIILSVSFGKPGVRRKIDSSEVEVDADKDLIHVSKEILSCEEYKAVGKLDAALRTYLMQKCLPSNKFFRRGFYMLPLPLISEVDEEVLKFKAARVGLIDVFLSVYPERVEQDKARLRGQFDQTDYPIAEEVRRAFYLKTRYLTLSSPDMLKGASAAIFARQEEEDAPFWQEAREEIGTTLRPAMAGFVGHLVEKLSGANGEKPKIFRDSAVTKLTAFLEAFEKRNITDDGEMLLLVQRARAIMVGVDPQTLRENGTVRETVTKGFEVIKESLDGMMTTRTRQIRLPD